MAGYEIVVSVGYVVGIESERIMMYGKDEVKAKLGLLVDEIVENLLDHNTSRNAFAINKDDGIGVGMFGLQKRPYTEMTIAVVWDKFTVAGTGFSKCRPEDEWDGELGFKISLDRALDEAAELLCYLLNDTDVSTIDYESIGRSLGMMWHSIDVAHQYIKETINGLTNMSELEEKDVWDAIAQLLGIEVLSGTDALEAMFGDAHDVNLN